MNHSHPGYNDHLLHLHEKTLPNLDLFILNIRDSTSQIPKMSGTGTKVISKWSDSKQFSIEHGGATFTIFFDDRDLIIQTQHPDQDPFNTTIQERMFVPGLSQFKRGVQFRYFRSSTDLFLQFPEFDGRPSFVFELAAATGLGYKYITHTEIPCVVFDVLAQQHKVFFDHSEKTERLIADRQETIDGQKQRLAVLEKKVRELEEIKREKEEYIDALPRNELRSLRDNKSMTDFTIICKDGSVLNVHKAVLGTFWPFFATMMENTCKEAEESTLKLEFDRNIVEIVLADIYGNRLQSEQLTFQEAVSSLEFTGIYDLPELAAIAYERVLLEDPKLVLADCVGGWKSARLGNHTEAKKFFSEKIISKSKKNSEEENTADFEAIDREELLELFFDSMRVK